jgi:uncharacterized protein (TIGR02453 family)
MTKSTFAGFPPEAISFLRGLKRNNRREWFQPRKHLYEAHLRNPMCEFVEALNIHLARFAPEHRNEPARAIYRIYRDTRFSADKTPYKTHIAAIFPRRGLEKHVSASFYVALSIDDGIEVAGGVYMPGPEELLAIRTWLAENHARFQKAARKPEKLMGPLHGEALQRVPKGFDPAHPAAGLIKQKQWLYYTTLDLSLATSRDLLPEVAKRFRAMAPVLDMLNAPLSVRRSQAAREKRMFAEAF